MKRKFNEIMFDIKNLYDYRIREVNSVTPEGYEDQSFLNNGMVVIKKILSEEEIQQLFILAQELEGVNNNESN